MNTGNFLIGAGVVLVLVGLAVRLGWFGWFGHLPGDIRIERGDSAIYAPIVSMLVISVVGSLLLNLGLRLFRR